ncbi:queuosine Biosynthesis QueE [Klebsiella pneumoniae]|nr:queuosine Biosynthesis QueE [Klebsiella pneumoniae]
MQYPINEMFQTLQGEGYFTGVPAIFIRLQGCPVGCAWCDTKHTWDKLADREVSLFSILAKTKESDKWGPASSEDLLAIIGRQGWTARHVVITGGEPCIHDLTPLTSLLEQNGFSCQIETSGTHEVRCSPNTWVTVSPKVNMRGGYDVLSQALQRANEIKHPVGRVRDIEALDELLETLSDDKPRIIALQPISPERRCDAPVYRHLHRPQLAPVYADAQVSEYCLIKKPGSVLTGLFFAYSPR